MAAAGSLGTAIRARLDELGLPARRFTAAGYISAATLSRVFAGQDSLRDPARAAELERGLGWRSGSINAVRAGRAPLSITVANWPRPDGDWRAAAEAAWNADETALPSQSSAQHDTVSPERIVELVDFLYATVHPADGSELSNDEVARRVAEGGGRLSSSDLRKLRDGTRRELDRRDAQALAGAFGVPTSYFFDSVDAGRVRDQLLAVAALREAGVEQLAFRLAGLSADDRHTAEVIIAGLKSAREKPRSES